MMGFLMEGNIMGFTEINKRVFINGKKYLWKYLASNGSVMLHHGFDDGFSMAFNMPPHKEIIKYRA